MACDAATLAKESACLNGALSHKQTLAAMLWVIATANSMSTNPSVLAAEASCIYSALSEKQILAAILYVFCTGGTGGGGSGTGFTFANYGGGQPNFTPSGGTGAAVDTSNGTVWLYYNSQWN